MNTNDTANLLWQTMNFRVYATEREYFEHFASCSNRREFNLKLFNKYGASPAHPRLPEEPHNHGVCIGCAYDIWVHCVKSQNALYP